LPKDEELITRSDEKEATKDWDSVVDGLEVAKRTLGFVKGNAMDAIKKYKDVADGKVKTAEAKCKALEIKASAARTKLSVAKEACELLCGVIGVVGTNPACYPCRAKVVIAETAYGVAKGAVEFCGLVVLTGLAGFLVAHKLGLWISHWIIKVA